jgi:hypothetical protein
MDSNILDALTKEAVELEQKLAAVRYTLAIYGAASKSPSALEAPPSRDVSHIRPKPAVKMRISGYSNKVRRIARHTIATATELPVPTRNIVEAVKAEGIEIRGQNELNAVSALLSRHDDFVSNGRSGWTLNDITEDTGNSQKENEVPNGNAADTSETGWPGVAAPAASPSNPQTGWTS